MNHFFWQLDSRLTSLNLKEMFYWGRLTETGAREFYFQTWAIAIAVSLIAASLIILLIAKKPRQRIPKLIRMQLRKFAQVNLVLNILFLVFLFFRDQGLRYLDMRLWIVLLTVLITGNIIYTFARLIVLRFSNKNSEEKVVSSDSYNKYLPKKKKKK